MSTPTNTSLLAAAVSVGVKDVPTPDPLAAEIEGEKIVLGESVRVYPLVVDTVRFPDKVPFVL
jgi:hypothetical protein